MRGAGRASKETIDAIVSLLDEGGDIELLSTESGYSVETIRKWQRKYGKGAGPRKAPTGLRARARAAAGMGAPPVEEPKVEREEPPKAPEPPKEPVITPDQLMAIIDGLDSMLVKTIAGARNKKVPLQVFVETAKMPKETRDNLEQLAPFAAPYAHLVLRYAQPIMAGVFLGTWVMDVVVRLKLLRRMDLELQGIDPDAPRKPSPKWKPKVVRAEEPKEEPKGE